jgi:hypothetical protein
VFCEESYNAFPTSLKKKRHTTFRNWGSLDYLDKPANHANLVERKNKRKKKYKKKFSTISILKNKIDKNNFKKIIKKTMCKKKKTI